MNFEELIVLIDGAVYRHHHKHLRDIDVLVLRESLNQKSYDQIADDNNYTGQYLRQDVGPKLWRTLSDALGDKISKKNCATILECFWNKHRTLQPELVLTHSAESFDGLSDSGPVRRAPLPEQKTKIDWGDSADSTVFYGRESELEQLSEWVTAPSCRLITIIGMGGMGKTALSLKLTELVQSEFDFVMVHSMRNAPKLSEVLGKFFNFVGLDFDVPKMDLDEQLQELTAVLRDSRCLLILDNFETLLAGNTRVGEFSPNYEDYGVLLQHIADQSHQSCVILTSRELPQGLGIREGANAPVRTLKLSGIKLDDAQSILNHKGIQNVDIPSLEGILSHYGGNPLALKIVASGIMELCGGDLKGVVPFLEKGMLQFEDIEDLLGRQFQRLDDTERQIMYWLALYREPISLIQLEQDILRFNISRQIPKAVQSLRRRSLLERSSASVFLQPVVMEYVSQRLLESLTDEVAQNQYVLLQTYALLNAQAKDYIRAAQERFILTPLLDGLRDIFDTNEAIYQHLLKLLERLRQETPRQPSYACGNLLNLFRHLNGHLDDLDCSQLSVWQAHLAGVSLQNINFNRADLSRSVFSPVLSTTLSVTFSPDGDFIAMGNADNNVRVWTVKDYKEHKTLQGHSHWVSAVSFCPDGQVLVSGSFDKTLKLWDLETGACLDTLEGHQSWIWAVVCSPDAKLIASSGDDHTIRIWDRATGECLHILEGHNASVMTLAFSPDGKTLASATYNVKAPVKLWDLDSLTSRDLIPSNLERRIRTVAFSPDGQYLATGSLACMTEIWEVETGKPVRQLRGHAQPVTCVAFAPQYDAASEALPLLATGSQDCSLRLWNYKTGEVVHTLKGHPNGIWSIAFHPFTPILVSGSNDSTVKLWNTRTGESVRTLQGYSTGIKSIAVHPHQPQLACAGDNTLIHFWDYENRLKQKTLSGHSSWIWSLKYSQDGKSLISAGNDNLLKLWNLSTGEPDRIFVGHRSLIFSLDFNADSSIIASGSDDHTARLWESITGHCLAVLPHAGRVWSVAFSPDGKYLACGNCETLLTIWDTETYQPLRHIEAHTSLVWAIAFHPDGKIIASGSDDNTVKLWDVDSGECLKTFTGHQGSIWGMAFSSDGKILATGSHDTSIRLWDMETQELRGVLYGHQSAIWDLTFHGNDQIMSASQEGTVKVWNVKTLECQATLRDIRPYEGMDLTEATGLTDAQTLSLVTLGAIA